MLLPRSVVRPLLLLGGTLALASCGGDGPGAPPPAPPAPPANVAPTADAGQDSSQLERDRVFLDANGSSDSDGTVAALSWRQVAGPSVAINDRTETLANFVAPEVTTATELRFTLEVTDDNGAQSTDTVSVTITPDPVDDAPRVLLTHGGEQRVYVLYRPSNHDPSAPTYLVLHGGTGSMNEVLLPDRTTRRWVEIADQTGALLLVPNGYSETTGSGLTDRQSWNDFRNDQSGRVSLQDDVGFLVAVLNDAQTRVAFNASRVFIAGSSNGGMMTMTMLIERPDLFAAGASFIGALPEQAVADPPSATPIFLLNGTLDTLILFNGGPVAGDGAPTRSVADTLDYWVRVTGADAASESTQVLADLVPDDGCTLAQTDWSAPGGRPVMRYVEARGGAHSIPDPDPPLFSDAALALIGNRCRERHGIDMALQFFANATQ